MFFGVLSAIALVIGAGSLAHDLSTEPLLTPEEEYVQMYEPAYPAYCEDE